jgi:hypothetical protein
MNNSQLEDVTNFYFFLQSNVDVNSEEEQNYEEEQPEEKEEYLDLEEEKDMEGKEIIKFCNTKRIRVLPKKYKTYTMDFKKRIIDEVRIYFY